MNKVLVEIKNELTEFMVNKLSYIIFLTFVSYYNNLYKDIENKQCVNIDNDILIEFQKKLDTIIISFFLEGMYYN